MLGNSMDNTQQNFSHAFKWGEDSKLYNFLLFIYIF